MCGITGIWNRRGQQVVRQTIVRFTDSIAHRGPDGEGYYFDESGNLALGHRRLTILDTTEAGKQPMTLDDKLWITYNGEIFNFLELRRELEQLGHRFKSDTDTEVFLAAYKVWGMDCFSKFNGMWAAGIYDQSTKELLLIRDRYGIKPLYYLNLQDQRFAFASETIAFRHLEGFQREFDAKNLTLSFHDAKILEGRGLTVFKDIQQVKPGHGVKITPNEVKEFQWWETDDRSVDVPTSYDDQLERFKTLFADACALRMRSDVPLGSALSGGLDSSSVYATLHEINKRTAVVRKPENWQSAYTLVFPGSVQDERIYAEQVAQHVGGKLQLIEVDYDKVDDIVAQTRLFDSIYDNPNFILVSLYKKMRKDGIKVSLDGHGVDELLFGYPEMLKEALQLTKAKDNDLKSELEEIIESMKYRRPEEKGIGSEIKEGFERVKNLVKRTFQEEEEKPKHIPFIDPTVRKPTRQKAKSFQDIADRYFYKTSLPTILRNFDRASMQAGVEVRMPFMDYRIVDFLHDLPFESKVKFPFTKRIVRDAMVETLPEEIWARKSKIGLVAPMDQLLNNYLEEFAMDILSSKKFIESPYWNGDAIRKFAARKTKDGSWTMQDGMRVWPFINAHLIQ